MDTLSFSQIAILNEQLITRYQSSNKGNFPSLNLTHKEVGGSYYTVREIFREVIQENKVLGPGNFSAEESMIINFSEADRLNLLPTDPSNPLTLSSTYEHAVHEKQTETHLFSTEDEGICQELAQFISHELSESDVQEIQIKHTDYGSHHHECALVDENNDGQMKGSEADQRKPSENGQIKTKISESTCIDVHGSIAINYAADSVMDLSQTSTISSLSNVLTEEVSDVKENILCTAGTENTPVNNDVVSESLLDYVEPQMNITMNVEIGKEFGKVEDQSFTFHSQDTFPMASDVSLICGADGLNGSPEAPDTDVHASHFVVDSELGSTSVNQITLSKCLSTGQVEEKIADDLVEPVMDSSDGNNSRLSSSKIFQRRHARHMRTLRHLAPVPRVKLKAAPLEVHPILVNGKSSIGEPHSSSLKVPEIESRVEPKNSDGYSIGESKNLDEISRLALERHGYDVRESPEKVEERPEDTETNPVLAVIKAFVAAIVKFWTE
ncbi:hypothetical protein QJS04_geneDACA000240 [Acorus gramineus]|uniref:AT3G52170-like helix-turn-helix domain-containing protein n=1 Tax=Acorus gramineus TaxID=55184 RepID=A0AAV9ATT5_ACOGR|nr:hypothetical protein QJS04_geneDACA000240 [Acorus gramineus]